MTSSYDLGKLSAMRKGTVVSTQLSDELAGWAKAQAKTEELSLSAWLRALVARERQRRSSELGG